MSRCQCLEKRKDRFELKQNFRKIDYSNDDGMLVANFLLGKSEIFVQEDKPLVALYGYVLNIRFTIYFAVLGMLDVDELSDEERSSVGVLSAVWI